MQNYITQWKGTIDKLPKLRTFILFKNVYRPEPYIKMKISRRRRSLMSRFRSGILPLEVETGRYAPIYDQSIKKNRKRKPSERICKICDQKETEDEFHFLCICPKYSMIRTILFNDIVSKCD